MKARTRGESGFLNINTAISPTPQPPVIQPLVENNKSNQDLEEPEEPVEPEDSEDSEYEENEKNRVFITTQLNTAISSIENSMERFRKHRYNSDNSEADMGNVLFRGSLQK